MESILKNTRFFAKEKTDPVLLEEYRALLRDLEALQKQIRQVDSNFNMATDEDLVESYIYESNALAARYRYLMREAKEQKSRLGSVGAAGRV